MQKTPPLPYLRNIKQAYFEVTNKCNLTCGYCYAIQRRSSALFFSIELFQDIVNMIARHAVSKHIDVIFHGGEPLLLGYDFYKNCIEYAKLTMNQAGKEVSFGIQTNLTLMTKDFLWLFEKYSVSISSSIDGPEDIHNSARQRWKDTMFWLREIKLKGMAISPIVVCSKHNNKRIKDIFTLFDNVNIRRIQVNIATSNTSVQAHSRFTPLSVNEILCVYKDIFNYCYSFGIREEKMYHMLSRYIGLNSNFRHCLGCENPFCHAGTSMIVFTPKGEMFPCSPCVSLSICGEDYKIGNFGESISCDHYLERLARFHEKDDKYKNECLNCNASLICEFGCPGFDRIDPITQKNKCEATKCFFSWLEQTDKGIIEKILNI